MHNKESSTASPGVRDPAFSVERVLPLPAGGVLVHGDWRVGLHGCGLPCAWAWAAARATIVFVETHPQTAVSSISAPATTCTYCPLLSPGNPRLSEMHAASRVNCD